MDIDDDSENDSDYVPGADEEKSVEDADEKQLLKPISKSSRKKIDAIWLEMQEEDRKSVEAVMMRSINYIANRDAGKNPEARKVTEVILCSIFGKRTGKRLAATQAVPEEEYNPENVKKRALESVQQVRKKQKVTETRKFAGQEITVQRTVQQSTAEVKAAIQKTGAKKGLDTVLDTIKGPKTVSTVAKSSMDWDVYKEKEGLEEDLQAAAKDGYLTRKDFLERCDVRTYEVEKGERVLAKAGGAPASGRTVPK